MKKGFTLVEILTVLAVIGIIALIIVPSVTGTLNASRQSAYKKQIAVLETATEKWGVENINLLPQSNSDEVLAVDFNTLYTAGQITNYPVINPVTNEELEGCILITYNSQYQQHEYNYTSDLEKCTN